VIANSFAALAALIFVIGLVFAGAWVVRRAGLVPGVIAGKQARDIDIIEQRPLDARNRVVALRWRGDDYLVVAGTEHIAVIDKKPAGGPPGVSVEPEAPAVDTATPNTATKDNPYA